MCLRPWKRKSSIFIFAQPHTRLRFLAFGVDTQREEDGFVYDAVTLDINVSDTSASYISLKVAEISRVTMPLTYSDKIWLSICVSRVWFFLINWGLKVFSRSRGVFSSISPSPQFTCPRYRNEYIKNRQIHNLNYSLSTKRRCTLFYFSFSSTGPMKRVSNRQTLLETPSKLPPWVPVASGMKKIPLYPPNVRTLSALQFCVELE